MKKLKMIVLVFVASVAFAEPINFLIEMTDTSVLVDGILQTNVDLNYTVSADTDDIKLGQGLLGADLYDNITVSGSSVSLGIDILCDIDSLHIDVDPLSIVSPDAFLLLSSDLVSSAGGAFIDGLGEYDGISDFERENSIITLSSNLAFSGGGLAFVVQDYTDIAFSASLQAVPEPSTYAIFLLLLTALFFRKRLGRTHSGGEFS